MASLATSRRWVVAHQDPDLSSDLTRALGVAPLVARIMVAHGISSVDEGRAFLTPSLERDWADPLNIPGMDAAAERVACAVRSGERIAVFGDFDVDGITSTCLLTEALRALGADARPFIPRRFDEGYGLSRPALERMVESFGPDIVVTVDNGIAARDEAAWLVGEGIDLVVTDHHEPSDLVPRGVPVADPKLADAGPSRELAGVGVALKLVQVLGERLGSPGLWRGYTELAALGTVSDMMLLTPENRALVADGIAQMRATSRAGYIALAALARTDLSQMTADALSFSLIPRLNAAGRVDDPELALDLLMERDPIEAGRLAARLEEVNARRRELEADLTAEALELVERTYAGGRVVVAGGEGWHEGVKGIVASRIVNRYHVPALLFSIEDGVARGSGRSVGSVNLFAAVERLSDMLVRFGGHPGAVGVTLRADRLDEFARRLDEELSRLPAEQFEDVGEVAAVVTLDELTLDAIEGISALEPFGQGNRVPLLAATGVTMSGRSLVGKNGDHLRFNATDGASSVPAIMFRAPDPEGLVACDSAVDLVFEAVAEHWQGRVKPKLMVKDVLRRGAPDPAPADPGAQARDQTAPCPDEPLAVPGAGEASSPAGALGREPARGADGDVRDPAARRTALAALSADELDHAIVRAFIGDRALHPAQAEALQALAAGESCLAVMGTGRGKSLVFQVHAVREAISAGRASILVYPLRALIADQAFHLVEGVGALGVSARALTGETPAAERAEIFSGLASGAVDIVLTTPEFLQIHADELAASGRVGFVVVDEAHHVAGAKGGDREAYLAMPRVLAALGNPVVLAATATADAACAAEIASVLGTTRLVVDDADRPNLAIEDDRSLSSREDRLVSIVATGEKCVVYVNSREHTVALARTLRKRVPDLAGAVAYYNGGLSRSDRARVERAFRDGSVRCIVSTSAFGEGVNLPDIRHVVLYHMPFSATEFNQMSGRAGRDGAPALIHLMYTVRDARINERLLDAMAPERDELVVVYRALQTMWRASRDVGGLRVTDLDVANMCLAIDARRPVPERSVESALGIFEELGFARVTGPGDSRAIEMLEHPGRMSLTSSIRYLEGLRSRLAFSAFRGWALDTPARDMLQRIARPITPGRPGQTG